MSVVRLSVKSFALIAAMLFAFADQCIAGELDVTTSQFPTSTTVGGSLFPAFTLTNLNSMYSLGACSTNVTITGPGGSVVYNESRTGIVVVASASVPVTYTVPFVPALPGTYTATVYANSAANIRGSQIRTVTISVTALVPCPKEPILTPGEVLYLGTASSGSISYSAGGLNCCFVIRPHIVTGHGVLTFAGGQSPRTVSGSAPTSISINVDRAKAANMELVVRMDWRACDNTSSGSDYIAIKLGTAPAPDVTVAQPFPGTMSNTPNAAETSDPVNAATGEFFTRPITDLLLDRRNRLALEITRSYASNLHATGIPSSGFGDYWTHRYAYHMTRGTNEIYIHSPAGRQYRFAWTGSAYRLDYPKDFPYKLEIRGADYAFFDPQAREIWRFDTTARMPRSVDDIHGYRLRFDYNDGWMSRITNPFGRSIDITRDTLGLITRVADGARAVNYSYNDRLLASVTDPMNGVTRYEYTSNALRGGFLTRIVLPMGNAHLTNSYDSDGRVVRQTDAFGNISTMLYTGSTTTMRTPRGSMTNYVHNERGELTAMTDALDKTIAISNDASTHRTGYTDRLGKQHANTYAASGNISSRTAADGSTITINDTSIVRDGFTVSLPSRFTMSGGLSAHVNYDTAARVVGFTDFGGERWTYAYDAAGNLTRTASPLGAITVNTYDASGNLRGSSSTVRGNSSFTYNLLGQLIRKSNPDGSDDVFVVDLLNRVTQSTTAAGVETNTYDANGNLTASTIDGETMKFTYDAMDRLTAVSNAANQRLHNWTYAADGQIATSVDQHGVAESFAYNPNGWRSGSSDAISGAWTNDYDDEGAVTGINGPEGMRWSISRDAMGRPIAVTNALGATATQTLNALGLPSTQTTPSGVQREFSYDGMRVTRGMIRGTQIDADFVYGGGDLLSTITDPIGGMTRYGRDSLGRITSITGANGGTTRYTFDRSGRVSALAYPGNGSVAFVYSADGRSTTMRIGSDSLFAIDRDSVFRGTEFNLKFDSFGNMITSNQLTIRRDASGRFAGVGYSASDTSLSTTFGYDANGRVASVSDWRGLRTTFEYDDAGRRTLLERPNGTSVRTEYDAAGRTTLIDEGAIGSIRLSYNADGKVESIARTGHLRPTSNDVNRSWTYNTASQVNGHTYDTNGNHVSGGGLDIAWSSFQRPVRIGLGDSAVTLRYDWFGNPTGVDATTIAMNYAYPVPQPDMFVGQSGNAIIVRDPDGTPLYEVSANGVKYISLDHNGSPVALTDSGGAITARRAYSPLGEVVGDSGTFVSRIGYGGGVGMLVGNAHLLHVGGHLYDPSTGRAPKPDLRPTPDPRSLNPYSFIGRNVGSGPTTRGDNSEMGNRFADIFQTPVFDITGTPQPQMPPPEATDAPRETPKSVKPTEPAPAPTAGGTTTPEPGPLVAPTPPVHVETTPPTVRRQRYTMEEVIRALRGYNRRRGRTRSHDYIVRKAERFMELSDQEQVKRMNRWTKGESTRIEPPAPEYAPVNPTAPDNPDAPDGGSILDQIQEVIVPC